MRRVPLLFLGIGLWFFIPTGDVLGQLPDLCGDILDPGTEVSLPYESADWGTYCFDLDAATYVIIRVEGDRCIDDDSIFIGPGLGYVDCVADMVPGLASGEQWSLTWAQGESLELLPAGRHEFSFGFVGQCECCCFDDGLGPWRRNCGSYAWTDCAEWRFQIIPYAAYQLEIIPQKINPYARGTVPVAILGNEQFDISDIDLTTLRFGPSETPCRHDLTDEWTYNEHLDDINLDGFMDLMTHFKTQDLGISCGDTEAVLTGTLLDGTPLGGFDTFETIGCNSNRPGRAITSRDSERIQRKQPRLNSEEQQLPGDLVEEQRVN